MVLDTQKQKGSREMTQTIEQLRARIAELEEENARLKAECDDIKQVQFPRKLEAIAVGWKKQLAAAQEEWNQCSGLLDDAHRSIEMLEDQLAKAEQRVAELEAENAKLHEQVDLQVPKMAFTQLKGQLAAEQLNNKLLREALEFLNARIVTMDLGGVVERALSLLASTEALDEYVAEKVKEATATQKGYYEGVFQDGSKQIAKAFRQRDLAVNVPVGYTAEELERDNPYNQWMYE